jgi:hypothetical protein
MAIIKKKTVESTPEVKVQEACIIVEQQVDQFKKMTEEVKQARKLREEAIEETQKEIASLEAKLHNKKVGYATFRVVD